MAKRKTSKKPSRRPSKTLSFLIGVATIIAVSLFILAFAHHNNYKSILGKQTTVGNSK